MRIAVLDLETDPFEHGADIRPFVSGYYDGERFVSYWGDDCIERTIAFLEKEEPACIYAHNGGRFDFFYFLKHLAGEMVIINNRIVKAFLGKHELRDSYAIMPFALEKYEKTKIDYDTFRRPVREKHRNTIVSYLRDDCVSLHLLCDTFRKEFGDKLTVGSAALTQLKQFHQFKRGNNVFDAKFRSQYYFGGRNQVFQSGIIHWPVQVYDVNSMYPFVMSAYLHPVGTGIILDNRINDNTAFITVEGWNDGAFPTRQKDGSLDFTVRYGRFYPTIHEYRAALDTGSFKPKRILKTMGFVWRETFSEFVTHFYDARNKAREEKDKIHTLFYKFVLNSAYGKFAQNPENYFDWRIAKIGELFPDWHECKKSCEVDCKLRWLPGFMNGEYIIWKRQIQVALYYNIATGASITGAARAVLLRGLRAAKKPVYCDTDSIICRSLSGVPIHDSELGSWKLETSGTMAAICGKKLYAIFDEKRNRNHKCTLECEEPCPLQWCIKKAHKGAHLEGEEILRIATGETIETANKVPAFKFDGTYSYTKREIRRTAK